MDYLDKNNNPVPVETWQWIAIFEDGSVLRQYDQENYKYSYFSDIDQSKVIKFGLVKTGEPYTEDNIVDIPKTARLIHYYDNIIQKPATGETIHHRLYCFGYEIPDTESLHIRDKKLFTVLPNDVVIDGKVDSIEDIS